MAYNPNNPNGSTTSANSAPVVIANDQTAIAIQTQSDHLVTGTLTALNSTVGVVTNGANTAIFQLTGTWSGTVTFEGSNDNFVTSQAIVAIYLGGIQTAASTTTINGFFSVLPQGFAKVQARMSIYSSGTTTVAVNSSAGQRIVVPLQGNPNNNQSLATQGPASSTTPWSTYLTSSTGVANLIRPDAQIKTSTDASSLFYDTFESALDTTNRWTASGTVPTSSLGTMTMNQGTTALAVSGLTSQPTFPLLGNMYNQAVSLITADSSTKTGAYRFFGLGTAAGSPTVAAPIANGIGFEWIDTTGALSGVVWSGGTKTQTLSLSGVQPTDGAIHRYQIYFKSSRVYFEIDNVAVGSIAYPNPQVTTLPILTLVVNGAGSVSPAAIFTSSFIGLGDSSLNNKFISDATFPWRKATVSASGALSVTSGGIPTSLGQQAAATSQPVALANEDILDGYITSANGLVAINANLLLPITGTGSTDLQQYRSLSIQVNTAASTTAVSVVFEGSNDGTNFAPIYLYDRAAAQINAIPINAFTTAASTFRYFEGAIYFRYFRARALAAIVAGSVQCFTTARMASYAPIISNVVQATASSLNTTVSGSLTTVATVTSLTTLANGQSADSAASTGSPVRIGGRVITTLDTSYVQGDGANVAVTTGQQLLTKQFATSENDWQASSGITPLATTTSTALKAAGAASIRNFVTGVQFYNTSATVSTTVSILDGASVIWTGYLPATTAALPVVQVDAVFQTPLRGTAATAMNVQLGTTLASVYYNVQGYQSF